MGRDGEGAGRDGREVEAAVQAILGRGQAEVAILVEVEGMVGAARNSLEFAQHGVDHLEAWHAGSPWRRGADRKSNFLLNIFKWN